MAPEQAEGREVEPAADLYSLALVLYEALTGANPLRAGTAPATPRRPGTHLPPLRRQRRDLPRELGGAIDLALRPRPSERGDLDELRAALVAALPAARSDDRRRRRALAGPRRRRAPRPPNRLAAARAEPSRRPHPPPGDRRATSARGGTSDPRRPRTPIPGPSAGSRPRGAAARGRCVAAGCCCSAGAPAARAGSARAAAGAVCCAAAAGMAALASCVGGLCWSRRATRAARCCSPLAARDRWSLLPGARRCGRCRRRRLRSACWACGRLAGGRRSSGRRACAARPGRRRAGLAGGCTRSLTGRRCPVRTEPAVPAARGCGWLAVRRPAPGADPLRQRRMRCCAPHSYGRPPRRSCRRSPAASLPRSPWSWSKSVRRARVGDRGVRWLVTRSRRRLPRHARCSAQSRPRRRAGAGRRRAWRVAWHRAGSTSVA